MEKGFVCLIFYTCCTCQEKKNKEYSFAFNPAIIDENELLWRLFMISLWQSVGRF
jgi:hypothetical protein